MTSEEYWRLRNNKRYLHYTNQVSKVEKELKRLYTSYRKELLNELKIMTLTVQAHNSKSNQVKLNKIQDNIKKVDTILDQLDKAVDKVFGNYLVDIYISDKTDLINTLQKVLNKDDITFDMPNVKLVEELVRSNYWSGYTFSTRLHNNIDNLKYNLKEIMQAGVIKGQSYTQMARLLADKTNSSYKSSFRLIKTEMTAAITQANLDTYKQCGVEYVKIINSKKDNVCPYCKKKNNTKVKLNKARIGVNLPPYHPLCNCAAIPVVSLNLPKTDDIIEVD